jgi:hypothetical protein
VARLRRKNFNIDDEMNTMVTRSTSTARNRGRKTTLVAGRDRWKNGFEKLTPYEVAWRSGGRPSRPDDGMTAEPKLACHGLEALQGEERRRRRNGRSPEGSCL